MNEVIVNSVGIVLTALSSYIVYLLKTQRKDRTANSKGTMLLLRLQLIEYHKKYVLNKEEMASYVYQNFRDMYGAYKQLGGNSMVDKMAKELEEVHISKHGKGV